MRRRLRIAKLTTCRLPDSDRFQKWILGHIITLAYFIVHKNLLSHTPPPFQCGE
ncbi:MAG: hypothetical protein K2I71_02035 [Helicobacter sp.]|nr:hypothetical protein [Helicobacter sp.]